MRVSAMTDAQGKVFGTEMRRFRKEAGMNTVEFANYLGISPAYVSNIEVSNRKPSSALAERIADAFDTTVNEMLKPLDEKIAEERKAYGRELSLRRSAKGIPSQVIADALGIPLVVYREYELGKCSITDREKCLLDKLLGESEPKEPPKDEAAERNTPPADDVPIEICDAILEHIKDLKVDTDMQKKIWHYFSKAKMDAEERRLFG